MMNLNDFNYLYQGKSVAPLLPQDASLLKTIDIRKKQSGRALLLLHGFSSSPAVFRELISSFDHYDAVLGPVLPGHGDSISAFQQSTAADWLETAIRAYQQLSTDYTVIDVMGFSLGGLLAYHLSKQYSVNHLYLLAPALILQGPTYLQLMAAKILHRLGLRQIRNAGGDFYTQGHQEISYRRLPIAAIIEILTLVRDYQHFPPTCPIDLFLGRFDKVVDSAAVAALFKENNLVQIHWLNHSAHMLTLDGDIDQIIKQM